MKDPGPVSQNLTLCMILKKNSIYFTLWLLDFEEENIQLCIKTRYQGFFCSGSCIYIVFWYIVETQALCIRIWDMSMTCSEICY